MAKQTMQNITIYHNPRCSKSRQTLALLEAEVEVEGNTDASIEIVLYLETAPSAAEIEAICQKLNLQPTDIVRHKDAKFGELGLSVDDDRSVKDWCQLISENSAILERPIVVVGDKAAIGRPPESVLAIL